MSYLPQFEDIVRAIESLKIFPDTIKEFTEMLKQRYHRKHSPKELVWIDELCGVYHDNCYNYVEFIKRVIATQFLAKCLDVEEDSERRAMIEELKANMEAANRRLDRFLGTTERKEVLQKVDGVLTEMEEMQKKKEKKAKLYFKFSEWLKGKVLEQVSEIFAGIISPLWDMIYTNATLAVQSDYDHDTLKSAISSIVKNVPELESSMEKNRRALRGVNDVLNVLEREEGQILKTNLRGLYPARTRVEDACDDMMKHLKSLESS